MRRKAQPLAEREREEKGREKQSPPPRKTTTIIMALRQCTAGLLSKYAAGRVSLESAAAAARGMSTVKVNQVVGAPMELYERKVRVTHAFAAESKNT